MDRTSHSCRASICCANGPAGIDGSPRCTAVSASVWPAISCSASAASMVPTSGMHACTPTVANQAFQKHV
jgi:hypothetical protein